MGGRKKDIKDWWSDHIKELTELNGINIKQLLTNDVHPYERGEDAYHTIKKLVIYKYYIDIYTTIIKEHYTNFYYFDLFAGSGVVEVTLGSGNKVYLYGSALISVLKPRPEYKFKKYIFIENNQKRANTLKILLNNIKNSYENYKDLDYEVIQDDMNNINRYINFFDKCDHALVVVDPEGLEPNWSTISGILTKKRVDMLFTFMTKSIPRVLGGADDNQANKDKLMRFLGKDIDNITDFKDEYIRQLENLGYTATKTIKASSGRFGYDIIVATRPTSRGNPWLEPIDDLQPKLTIKDRDLNSIINQFLGKANSIDKYLHTEYR
jgi:three-Cys-motif partner protein